MDVQTTEKITINANTADLGMMDLLVAEGFYATRTEFIKTAIKALLERHEEDRQRLLAAAREKNSSNWFVGVCALTREDLEKLKRKGKTRKISGLGLLVIERDIPLSLLKQTVTSIKMHGVCRCAPEVRAHYGL